MYKHILFALTLLILSGCSQLVGERGNGVRTSNTYTVEPYHEIAISGAFEVLLQPANDHRVVLETDENLVDFIEIYVDSGKLVIHTDYRLLSDEGQQVRVPFHDGIRALTSAGASRITSADTLHTNDLHITLAGVSSLNLALEADNISLTMAGTGSAQLNGKTSTLQMTLSGAGAIDTKNLPAQKVTVELSGAGKAEIYALDTLLASVSGMGKIIYLGNPAVVRREVSGLGRVQKAGTPDK